MKSNHLRHQYLRVSEGLWIGNHWHSCEFIEFFEPYYESEIYKIHETLINFMSTFIYKLLLLGGWVKLFFKWYLNLLPPPTCFVCLIKYLVLSFLIIIRQSKSKPLPSIEEGNSKRRKYTNEIQNKHFWDITENMRTSPSAISVPFGTLYT